MDEGSQIQITDLFDETGGCTEAFRERLPELVGPENYYGKPETKEDPTKVFDDVKDFKGLLKQHLDTKRMVGKKMEGLVKVPGEGATAEEIAAFHKATGVPDKAEGYEFERPKELPEGMFYNEEMETHFKGIFKELGTPPAMAKGLLDAYNKAQIAAFQQQQDAETAQLEKDIAQLNSEPEFRGEEAAKSNTAILAALNVFGDEELKKLLADQKIADADKINDGKRWAAAGFDPVQRRIWLNIGKKMKLDTLPTTPGGGAAADDTARARAAGRYPNSPQLTGAKQ